MKLVNVDGAVIKYLQDLLEEAGSAGVRNFFKVTCNDQGEYEFYDVDSSEVLDSDYLQPVSSSIVIVVPSEFSKNVRGTTLQLKTVDTQSVIHFVKLYTS